MEENADAVPEPEPAEPAEPAPAETPAEPAPAPVEPAPEPAPAPAAAAVPETAPKRRGRPPGSKNKAKPPKSVPAPGPPPPERQEPPKAEPPQTAPAPEPVEPVRMTAAQERAHRHAASGPLHGAAREEHARVLMRSPGNARVPQRNDGARCRASREAPGEDPEGLHHPARLERNPRRRRSHGGGVLERSGQRPGRKLHGDPAGKSATTKSSSSRRSPRSAGR